MGAVLTDTGERRQRWRETVGAALRVSRRIFRALGRKDVRVTLVLLIALAGSAIGVVYAAHLNRSLFNTLSSLQDERDAYQREWSQLLLEQSALSAHGRVEHLATTRMDMQVPGRDQIVVVPAKTLQDKR
ncbi:cell division protein FtsL [Marinobacteraceae bacterium S3BR75-40.1]